LAIVSLMVTLVPPFMLLGAVLGGASSTMLFSSAINLLPSQCVVAVASSDA
jgi:hypothetical protein